MFGAASEPPVDLKALHAKIGQLALENDLSSGVLGKDILLSMDGKGSWRDNVFVERLWRSVKYEGIYLKAYESVGQARRSIADYLTWYNQRRPHSSLADRTPDEAYFAMLPTIKTAA